MVYLSWRWQSVWSMSKWAVSQPNAHTRIFLAHTNLFVFVFAVVFWRCRWQSVWCMSDWLFSEPCQYAHTNALLSCQCVCQCNTVTPMKSFQPVSRCKRSTCSTCLLHLWKVSQIKHRFPMLGPLINMQIPVYIFIPICMSLALCLSNMPSFP